MGFTNSIILPALLGAVAIGLAIAPAPVKAATQTFGAGGAVTLADRSTNFDTIVEGTGLANFSDDGLTVSYTGLATCQAGACGTFPGFAGLSGGFEYSGSNNAYLSISATDAGRFSGLEFNIGNGFGSGGLNGFWEIFRDGSSVGSSSLTLPGYPTILGISDILGFDELRIAMGPSFSLPFSSFGFANAVAIDNLSAQMLSVVPLPASLPLFFTGLAGLGLMRRRQRRA